MRSSIELDVPLNGLKPGPYVCQLNVIDDAAGSFAFPRFAVLVREPPAPPAAAVPSVPAAAAPAAPAAAPPAAGQLSGGASGSGMN